MREIPVAAQRAVERLGHDVEPDPPFMSAADRWTCKACGRAVIVNGSVIYGSATIETCTAKEPDRD